MQPTAIDIEKIIRVVMQRLAVADDLMSGVAAIADTSELVLRERVITLAALDGKLTGKKKLRVHPRAVVTPAVVDELKRFKVELVRDAGSSTSTSTSTRLAPVLVCGSAVWFNSLARHLCPQQAVVHGCDDQAALGLIKTHLANGGRNALWLTTTPYAANVSAARAACCTAVTLASLSDLRAALDQADPQCLIIDSTRTTVAAIGNIVRAMVKHSRNTSSQR